MRLQEHLVRVDKNNVLPLVLSIEDGVPFSELDFQSNILPNFFKNGATELPEFCKSGNLAFFYHFRENPGGYSVLSRSGRPFKAEHYDGGAFIGFSVFKSTLYVNINDPLQSRPAGSTPNVISNYWKP